MLALASRLGETCPVLLVRVQLPDRPGALGTVATAMGRAGADISAMEIVEKGEGCVIDDFMLTIPAGALVDLLVRLLPRRYPALAAQFERRRFSRG